MTRKAFTKVRKWAEKKGYEVKDVHAYYSTEGHQAIRVIIDEHNSFKCEEQRSTIYMSVRGQKGNPAGLYLTHECKPSDGRFIRTYSFHKRTQQEMIEDMEHTIKRDLIK